MGGVFDIHLQFVYSKYDKDAKFNVSFRSFLKNYKVVYHRN